MRDRDRNIFRRSAAIGIIAFAALFFAAAGQADGQVRTGKQLPHEAEWTSTWTGPFTCAAVNASTNSSVAHITTDNEMRLNYTPPSTSDNFTYTSASGSKPRVLVGDPDTENTITTDNSSGHNSLDWTSTKAIAAVLIGGSGGNRLYWMPEGMALGTQFSGTHFQNPNGSAITKVAFCYHEPATVTIIKEALNQNNASTASFTFTDTNLGTSSFSLIDNNSVGPDRRVFKNIYKFAKWGNYDLTVTEATAQFWSLTEVSCVETAATNGPAQAQYTSTADLSTRKSTLRLEEGEKVTCTYKNKSSAPTASLGSISGRVTDAAGNGIRGAKVTTVNGMTGESNVAVTNEAGYYSFNDLQVSQFYFVSVARKGYSFADTAQSFTLLDDMVGLDFMAR